MKIIFSIFFVITVNVIYSQSSTDTIFEQIEWLRNNYPDDKWMHISKKTMDDIFNLKIDTKIFSDPLDTLLSEKSKYTHIFAKVYAFSVVYYNLKHLKTDNPIKASTYGFECIINYYRFLKKTVEYRSSAMEFYINLQETNQLKNYVKKKTRYLIKD
jgi:hypothetical protein